jgi:hypothetical protein
MMTDRPTATVDPAAQTAAARAATAVSSQIPSWFDDDSRPGGREARLAGLARPGAALLGIAVAGICWPAGATWPPRSSASWRSPPVSSWG